MKNNKNMLKLIFSLLFALVSICTLAKSSYTIYAMVGVDTEQNVSDNGPELVVMTDVSAFINDNELTEKSRLYIANYIVCSITPKSNSYLITINNIGVDTIDCVNINLNVVKDNGTYYASTSHEFTKVKVGKTSYEWILAKGSVQETITLTGTATDGGQIITLNPGTTERWNFAGGKYGTMKALDGERHHMPSDSVSPLTTYSGPCIRMTKSDHALTGSYANTTSSIVFREKEKELIEDGKFLAAQKLGIDDIQSKFGSKYDYAISDMITYTLTLGYTE